MSKDFEVNVCLDGNAIIKNHLPVDFTKCTNELQFKKQFCYKSGVMGNVHTFFIETEETCAGFPDVLFIGHDEDNNSIMGGLVEFKFADKSGAITFKPSQPAFYKKYKDLNVEVVAYNKRTNTIHRFLAIDIFDETSHYFTNGKARINLCKVEAAIKKE